MNAQYIEVNVEYIVNNNGQAQQIVNYILTEERDAQALLNALEEEGMIGAKLGDYFEDHFGDNHASIEGALHDFVRALRQEIVASRNI